jgi:hypothetical protein
MKMPDLKNSQERIGLAELSHRMGCADEVNNL